MPGTTDQNNLVPAVRQTEANAEIILYEGPMKLHSGMDQIQKPEATGKAIYSWFPFPKVTYELQYLECDGTLMGDEFKIAHEKIEEPALFYKLSQDYDGHIKGFTDDFESTGKNQSFTVIQFQFPNLLPYSQIINNMPSSAKITFSTGNYMLMLQNTASREQYKPLLKGRGYLLNGVVEITKGNTPITLQDAVPLMDIFAEFLSFFNGLKVKPLFITGFIDGTSSYSKAMSEPDVHEFLPVYSWEPRNVDEKDLNIAWQRFYELWQTEDDKDCLQLATHWYLESLTAKSGVEASIALVQNSLELLSSRILVEREHILDSVSADRMSASSKINVLLNWAKISNQIPYASKELIHLAKANNLKTGPEVITYIRNSVVHPHSKNRKNYKKLDITMKHQALLLAIQYVELILLKLLEYNGHFYNRVAGRDHLNFFKTERVPWAV